MKSTLQSGLTLSLPLSPTQVDLLLAYQALIAKWNRVYNLTAVRSPEEMLTHHLLDSLSVVPALTARFGAEQPFRLLDVGAGAGLPGVVIAIALPQAQVTCVDTVAKKASFIRQVAAELGLKNLRAEHARVEALLPSRPTWSPRELLPRCPTSSPSPASTCVPAASGWP